MERPGGRRVLPRSLGIAAVAAAVAAALGAALWHAAFLEEGAPASHDAAAEAGAAPADPNDLAVAPAVAGRREAAMAPASAPAEPPKPERLVTITLSRPAAPKAPVPKEPLVAPLGKGKTASLTLLVMAPGASSKSELEAAFVGGLNDGAKAKGRNVGSIRFDALYPGRGILRIKSDAPNFGQADREVVLESGSNFATIDLARAIQIRGKITDAEGSGEVHEPSIEIDGVAMKPERAGYLTSGTVWSGKLMIDFTAKNFERRRESRTLQATGRSRTVGADFELRRGGPVIVRYSGLRDDAPAPIAVLLPSNATSADAYPFEKVGFAKCDRAKREAVFEGVPPQEKLEARVLSDAGVSIPILKTLPFADPLQPETRVVHFVMEERKPVFGRVVAAGIPLKGATVWAETENVASATEALLQHCGGLARIAAPVLPIARKRVETGSSGRFSIETFDLARPAWLVVTASGHRPHVEPIGDEGGDLGTIDLGGAVAAADGGAGATSAPGAAIESGPRVSVGLEIAVAGARRVRVRVEGEEGERPELEVKAGRAGPVELPEGTFLAKVEVDGAMQELTVVLREGTILRVER